MLRLIDSTPIPLGKLYVGRKSNGRVRGMKLHVVYDPKADCPGILDISVCERVWLRGLCSSGRREISTTRGRQLGWVCPEVGIHSAPATEHQRRRRSADPACRI